jgi:2-iminobutanoate/2-iminopropanoate deaminase
VPVRGTQLGPQAGGSASEISRDPPVDLAQLRRQDAPAVMTRHVISTPQAPAAIGPYSQAVSSGDTLFLSGQIPIDPSTGELVSGDIELETRRVLDNLGFVLRAGGADFADLVKTTIYLTDLADFAAVNRVYAERFGDSPPARATVQVSALPKGARVEIDGIAQIVKKSGS